MQKARGQAFRTEVRHSPPTACRYTVSGTISLPSQGFFSPFPHGTGSLSVTREYLALRDGPRRFPPDFTCPAVLGCPIREPTRFRLRDCHPLWSTFPDSSTSVLVFDSPALRRPDPATPPHASVLGFRLVPVRSPLLGESNFFLFLGVLRCLTSPRWLRSAYEFSGG